MSTAMNEYRVCTRCIMDTSDPKIEFDDRGECNHCRAYDAKMAGAGGGRKKELDALVSRIKQDGQGKKYDCIIGLSGGVDSTYTAYLVKSLGLRPLAVHLDNGWDEELAAGNIKNTVSRLGIDLKTHVIDWQEFRDLQLAYLKASVIDIEAISDHAITASLYRAAARRGIKYIMGGANIATEGIMPRSWLYNKNDLVNIRAINRRFGHTGLRSYPTLGILRILFYRYVKGIAYVPVLDYVDYDKKVAQSVLARELDWRDYGGKHYESVFTRFYQAHILPVKFGADKRRAHLSTLVCYGLMTRGEALAEVSRPAYFAAQLRSEKSYVAGKLGLTETEFEALMARPIRSHLDYPNDARFLRFISGAYRMFKRRDKSKAFVSN